MAKRQVDTDHTIQEHENTADIWRVLQRLFTLWHHAVLKQTPDHKTEAVGIIITSAIAEHCEPSELPGDLRMSAVNKYWAVSSDRAYTEQRIAQIYGMIKVV